MANEVLVNFGSLKCITFANHAAYSPAAANTIEVGTPQDVDMDWNGGATGILTAEARESDKVDLGNGSDIWAPEFAVIACLEYFTAPTTGTTVDFYWGASTQSTALNGNPGFLTGTDADYTGSPATLEEGLSQLEFIGSLTLTADVEFHIGHVGTFAPKTRYGILVAHNNATGQAIAATDAIETAVVFIPVIPEIQ
jgi:hypothetical protein